MKKQTDIADKQTIQARGGKSVVNMKPPGKPIGIRRKAAKAARTLQKKLLICINGPISMDMGSGSLADAAALLENVSSHQY